MHIKKAGAIQTAFRIGSSTINKRHPDYPGLKFLNVILGGYFGSRLMKNIREDKGFTYGIHSSVSSLDLSGFKVISTEVGKNNSEKAFAEIYKEIRLLQEKPVEIDELEVVRKYMAGEMIRMFDGPFAIAESFRAVWEFGLDYNYFIRLMNTIRTITPDEIIRLANTYYNIDDLYEITAG
jgi:predicted Zn-dependent peptidase